MNFTPNNHQPSPLTLLAPRAVPVTGFEEEGDGLFTLTLDMTAGAPDYAFRPGQFNMLYAPGVGEAAISIASGPALPTAVRHTIARVGRVTGWLAGLRPGDTAWARGPYGGGWPLAQAAGKHLLLVGGGVGVPPLMGVVYSALNTPGRFASVTLVAAAKTIGRLVYQPLYDTLAAQGITVRRVLDCAPAGWPHGAGLATEHLEPLAGAPGETMVFTCGPEPMMTAVARAALGLGVPPPQVFLSTERTMNCAVGLCGRCQLGPHFTCLDGPIYAWETLRPLMEVAHF